MIIWMEQMVAQLFAVCSVIYQKVSRNFLKNFAFHKNKKFLHKLIILGIDLNENQFHSLGKSYTNKKDSQEKIL